VSFDRFSTFRSCLHIQSLSSHIRRHIVEVFFGGGGGRFFFGVMGRFFCVLNWRTETEDFSVSGSVLVCVWN